MTLNSNELRRFQAILKIRSEIIKHIRLWLSAQEFTEVQGPLLTPLLDGTKHFEVITKNKKMTLNGRLQPYSDVFLEMFDKIYTIAPTFRQEHTDTGRHLIEFWRVEVSALNLTFEKMLALQEKMIESVILQLLKDVPKELNLLNDPDEIEKLRQVETPFSRLTYDEAINLLQKTGHEIFWGETIDWSFERELSKHYSQPFFITEFPLNGNNYFHKPVFRKPELTLSCDLIAPDGYGEITGGGEMERQKKVITKKLNELQISPETQRWYLNLKRFGNAPQAGFSLGVERFLRWLCKLDDIKQTVPFG